MGDFMTMGDLKKITGLPAHILNHAIERHGPQPVGRIGISRVWQRSQLDDLRESLRKTAAVHARSAEPAGVPA